MILLLLNFYIITIFICITDEGDVYVWGYGILGFGPEVKSIVQPTQIPPILFGKNAYEKTKKVRKF